jgi:hypothetical protein
MSLHLGFTEFFLSEDFNRRIFPSFTNALEKIERKQMREYLNWSYEVSDWNFGYKIFGDAFQTL